MFVRIKKFGNIKYAYLVKNKWTKKGPRQKTKKYLGRIIQLEKVKTLSFFDFINCTPEEFVKKNKFHDIVSCLFEYELICHGFTKDGSKYILNEIIAYPKTFRILNANKKNSVCLKINEGFACGFLLSRIENYKFKGEEKDPHRLAEMFIISGLKIESEIFVELYRKISNI